VQQKHVEVAAGSELAASVTTDRDDGDTGVRTGVCGEPGIGGIAQPLANERGRTTRTEDVGARPA
jgi:hypothetical protein